MRTLGISFLMMLGLCQADLRVEKRMENDPTAPLVFALEAKQVFSKFPPSGYATFLMTCENQSQEEVEFTLELKESHHLSWKDESSVNCAAASTTRHYSFLSTQPEMVSRYGHYGHSYLDMTLTGGGKSDRGYAEPLSCPPEASLVAFSRSSIDGKITDLNAQAASLWNHSSGHHGNVDWAAEFEPSNLPADERAFHGFSCVALKAFEWQALEPGVRDAILRYVKLGGKLALWVEAGDTSLAKLEGKLGFGTVKINTWTGPLTASNLRLDMLAAKTPSRPANDFTTNSTDLETEAWRRRFDHDGKPSPVWEKLLSALGTRSFGSILIALVLVGFGVLVGPVNLFVLAPRGQRQRLFKTTPLISLGATAVLGAVILYQDGTGGVGERSATVYLDAGDHALYTQQSEVSRTGLLLGNGFELKERAYVAPVLLDDTSRWTRLKAPDYRSTGQQQYSVSGNRYGGDFFQSRSLQGLRLEFVRSSRGRLEVGGTAEAPTLQSSLNVQLDELVYWDGKKFWTSADSLTTGKTAVLASLSGETALNSQLQPENDKPMFWASAKGQDAASFMEQTLPSIRWTNQTVRIFGPLEPQNVARN
jgi:hypothetical protein